MKRSVRLSRFNLLMALLVIAGPVLFAQSIHVPFVGCKSDGQVGPLDAPAVSSVKVLLAAGVAQQLAYYKAQYGPGVLAPRGWHCFSTYGSNGSSLFVAPEPIDSNVVFSGKWTGFAGDAVQISAEIGGTSGRFGVAGAIARLFPAHMSFVQGVIDEGIDPASDFPRGPYPHDKVSYKSNTIAEYVTPPQMDGMGTESRLRKNNKPIIGAAILTGDTPDLVSVNIRLSGKLSQLTPAILAQAEKDAIQLDQ